MTTPPGAPTPAAGRPSPSGVRRGGDRFQDLFVWGAALQVIQPGSRYSQLEVEIAGVGNLDDLVLRNTAGSGDIYKQVKWATNGSEPLTENYLLVRPTRDGRPTGRSLLQKLYGGYLKVNHTSAPTLRLVTNRAADSTDPLLGHIDGRTQLLVPRAELAGPHTEAARAVERWAAHLEVEKRQLLAMLAVLEIHTGRTMRAEEDHVCALMLAAGLDDSDAALTLGRGIAADWVVDGRREVTPEDIHAAIDARDLRRANPSATLVVQAIDSDPHVDEATVALDWVDLYDGDSAARRVQPRDPADWARMDHELTEAARTVEADNWTSTVVRGAMRQATFFRVGTALPSVRQHTLHYVQNGQRWSTNAPKVAVPALHVRRNPVGLGSDLAVAIGVAVDPTAAITTYLKKQGIPVNELVTITPAIGPDDQAVGNAGQAVAYAQQIRDLVRHEVDQQPDIGRLHLFLAGPGGLALMLGHRWNRVRPTVVYEHLGPGRGYVHAFIVEA